MRPPKWRARLLALAAVWGMSFLLIKVGDETFAPIQVAFLRVGLGAVVLVTFLVQRGDHLPRGRWTWIHLGVAALLSNAAPYALFAYGELHISAVLAGLLNAATPLFTFPIALIALHGERFSPRKLVSLGLGFVGVAVVLGVWNGVGHTDLWGSFDCLIGALLYGAGFVYMRRFLAHKDASSLSLAVGQLLMATLETAIVVPIVTHLPSAVSLRAIAAIVALGAVGTGFAYILNYTIIVDAGAVAASTVTYLIPIFSTLVGVFALKERITWYEPVGALIILSGAAATSNALPSLGARLSRQLRRPETLSDPPRSGIVPKTIPKEQ
ncbi:MAG: DMT family transporter [Ferrimicrobium sp.]